MDQNSRTCSRTVRGACTAPRVDASMTWHKMLDTRQEKRTPLSVFLLAAHRHVSRWATRQSTSYHNHAKACRNCKHDSTPLSSRTTPSPHPTPDGRRQSQRTRVAPHPYSEAAQVRRHRKQRTHQFALEVGEWCGPVTGCTHRLYRREEGLKACKLAARGCCCLEQRRRLRA
jgi:hypothetical protein